MYRGKTSMEGNTATNNEYGKAGVRSFYTIQPEVHRLVATQRKNVQMNMWDMAHHTFTPSGVRPAEFEMIGSYTADKIGSPTSRALLPKPHPRRLPVLTFTLFSL